MRCQVADAQMRADITPKNILLIGPTGVGKTEIARRLAKHLDAPFLKVSSMFSHSNPVPSLFEHFVKTGSFGFE